MVTRCKLRFTDGIGYRTLYLVACGDYKYTFLFGFVDQICENLKWGFYLLFWKRDTCHICIQYNVSIDLSINETIMSNYYNK